MVLEARLVTLVPLPLQQWVSAPSIQYFNPSVTIDYIINDPSNVKINIVNLEGKVVEVLESSFKIKGTHSVVWNPTDIASGVYFVNISSEDTKDSHKLMFLK